MTTPPIWYHTSPEPPKGCRWTADLILLVWFTRDPELDHLMTVDEAVEYLDARLAATVAATSQTSRWSARMIVKTWNAFALRTIRELTVDETIDCLEAGRRLVTALANTERPNA